MTGAPASKPNRPKRAARGRTVSAAPLSAFFEHQQAAVAAARANGVEEVEVTFRIPGSHFVTRVRTEDFAHLWEASKSRTTETPAEKTELVPTEKLLDAIREAKDVTIFYKTAEELFDALEKQD